MPLSVVVHRREWCRTCEDPHQVNHLDVFTLPTWTGTDGGWPEPVPPLVREWPDLQTRMVTGLVREVRAFCDSFLYCPCARTRIE